MKVNLDTIKLKDLEYIKEEMESMKEIGRIFNKKDMERSYGTMTIIMMDNIRMV